MKKYKKQFMYHSGSGKDYIVSVTNEENYECSCKGWTQHYPRRNCKHINYVNFYEDFPHNKPSELYEPIDVELWEKFNGNKVLIRNAIYKMKGKNNGSWQYYNNKV